MDMSDYVTYNDKVMEYLEYLEYPYLVQEFDPAGVAASINGSNFLMWQAGASYRMAAIIVFAMTMNFQILVSRGETLQ